MTRCVHCGSRKYTKNGKNKGIQQYICKDCNRSFSDKPRKFSYDDKERFLEMYMNNVGIRKAAHFMNCSPSMPVRWVRELAKNLQKQLLDAKQNLQKCNDQNLPDIIEMDEIFTRIKKGEIVSQFGLLIVDGEAKLLRMSLAKPRIAPKNCSGKLSKKSNI